MAAAARGSSAARRAASGAATLRALGGCVAVAGAAAHARCVHMAAARRWSAAASRSGSIFWPLPTPCGRDGHRGGAGHPGPAGHARRVAGAGHRGGAAARLLCARRCVGGPAWGAAGSRVRAARPRVRPPRRRARRRGRRRLPAGARSRQRAVPSGGCFGRRFLGASRVLTRCSTPAQAWCWTCTSPPAPAGCSTPTRLRRRAAACATAARQADTYCESSSRRPCSRAARCRCRAPARRTGTRAARAPWAAAAATGARQETRR